jgi:Ca2+-binding RTX toxin-like protein
MDIIGTSDHDTLTGTSENDYIEGLDGYDTLWGHEGRDHLVGGNDSDELHGGGGGDLLHGGEGDDRLDGGYGADVMRGGSGSDTYIVDDAGDEIYENNFWDWDTVEAKVSYVLGENLEVLILRGGADINGTGNDEYNEIYGNDGVNYLSGMGGTDYVVAGAGDTIDGGTGDDYIDIYDGTGAVAFGGDGNDSLWAVNAVGVILEGGAGNDFLYAVEGSHGAVLRGGTGDDEYYFWYSDDVSIVELEGEGYDRVYVDDQSYTLGDNIEAAYAYGWGHGATIQGNALDNEIYIEGENTRGYGGGGNDRVEAYAGLANGGAGDDWVGGSGGATAHGGGGNDTLDAGYGDVFLYGDSGSDTFVFHAGGWGVATVEDFNDWQDAIHLDGFAAIGETGTLGSRYFHAGAGDTAVAQDASDRIIFDTVSGALYYDRDGNGVEVQQQIGVIHLTEGQINHTDFVVV